MPLCSCRSFSWRSEPSRGQLTWILFAGSMRCIRRRGRFPLTKIRKFFLLRVGAARFTQVELIRLRGSKEWSCPTVRKTSGKTIGSSTGFMLRLVFRVLNLRERFLILLLRRLKNSSMLQRQIFAEPHPATRSATLRLLLRLVL